MIKFNIFFKKNTKSILLFVDGYIYLIYEKLQSLDMFKIFNTEVENQLNKRIKIIRSDHSGECYGRYNGSSE